MLFDKIKEVVEVCDPELVNNRLAEGWIILAVLSGLESESCAGAACYVLAKLATDIEATMELLKTKAIYFRYVCQDCQKEHLQPVLREAPEKTPIPCCCCRDSNMVFKEAFQKLEA
jgi:hypothetical protein